jgi:hypothetical protein
MEERVVAFLGFHPYVPPDTAITAGRPAPWDKFLAPKRCNAVSAVSGFNFYLNSIYEHVIDSTQLWRRRQIREESAGRKIKSVNVIAHIDALDFPL